MTTIVYKISTTELFNKEFSKLDQNVQKLVVKYVKKYLYGCENPRLIGKPLKGDLKGLWRYRIGEYRLICDIRDAELIIIALDIGHRKSIYTKKY